ncbi:hypothetical protein [Telluribacter humicola]|uniref:hypothetical protein n=1 Tax=Telluribacter humicola TaxID=1720261 RepID=UPI001A961DDF|nr:hypothetical protein [Telluribacter humicola]
MKHYIFEYTNQKALSLLIGACFALLLIIPLGLYYLIPFVGNTLKVILAIGIPFLVFFLCRKRINEEGEAQLEDSSITFILANQTHSIQFSEIKSYKVEHYNGTRLICTFKDNTKFKLLANSYFCKAEVFESLCDDLEHTINQYILETNTELVRKPSIFEQKWMPVFLVIMTLGIVWVFFRTYTEGKTPPTSIYTSIAIFAGLWVAYFKAREKSKGKVPQI